MKEKFYLLGLFAGDGWFQSRGIQIGTNSQEFATKIGELAKITFGKSLIRKRKYSDGHEMFIISVWNKKLRDEFQELLQARPETKSKTFRPPKMSADNKRAFIAGLFDAEGTSYLWKSRPRIGLGIYNGVAAKFIAETLCADDIKCYLSTCKNGEFKLDFTGQERVQRFFELYPVLRLTFPEMGKSQL